MKLIAIASFIVAVVASAGCSTMDSSRVRKEASEVSQQMVDTDGDGVADGLDRCPNSGAGRRVNRNGCEAPYMLDGDLRPDVAHFNSGSFEFRPDVVISLNDAVEFLKAYPQHAVIHGHADACGSKVANQRLSEKRARAVHKYLLSHGVDPKMIVEVRGFGADRLLEANGPYGCSSEKNRRVELVPVIRPTNPPQ